MGRHSAPDDEDQDLDVSGTLTAVRAEESPEGTTPRSSGRHSRGDDADDVATERDLVDPHAPTELFRPYTGVFDVTPAASTPAEIAEAAEAAEAHTTELPAVVEEASTTAPTHAPSTATINGAGPTAEPGTDTADLGAPVEASPTLDAPDTPAEPSATAPEPTADDRPPSGTRADLALLRTHPGLRARAAAAVLAPFVLYVIVLAVLSRFDLALLWIWIPIIVAGIAFGLVLDLAQRAQDRQRKDTPDSNAP